MKPIFSLILFIVTCFWPLMVSADIYYWIDENGVKNFTNNEADRTNGVPYEYTLINGDDHKILPVGGYDNHYGRSSKPYGKYYPRKYHRPRYTTILRYGTRYSYKYYTGIPYKRPYYKGFSKKHYGKYYSPRNTHRGHYYKHPKYRKRHIGSHRKRLAHPHQLRNHHTKIHRKHPIHKRRAHGSHGKSRFRSFGNRHR